MLMQLTPKTFTTPHKLVDAFMAYRRNHQFEERTYICIAQTGKKGRSTKNEYKIDEMMKQLYD